MKRDVHKPTYRSWQMMKNRCDNPNATDFQYYGGRGITHDPAWNTYEAFLADMGERPDELTLERVDSNGPYNKQNCVWASRLDQARNRDYTLDLTFNGITRKTWEWAKALGISVKTLHWRLWKYKDGQCSWEQVFTEKGKRVAA